LIRHPPSKPGDAKTLGPTFSLGFGSDVCFLPCRKSAKADGAPDPAKVMAGLVPCTHAGMTSRETFKLFSSKNPLV